MRLLRKPFDIAGFRAAVALANRRPEAGLVTARRADAGGLHALPAGRRQRR
jgi:hypothetical protein